MNESTVHTSQAHHSVMQALQKADMFSGRRHTLYLRMVTTATTEGMRMNNMSHDITYHKYK